MKRSLSGSLTLAGAILISATALARTPPGLDREQMVEASLYKGRTLFAQSSCDAARDRILDWAAHTAVEVRLNGYGWRDRVLPTLDAAQRGTGAEGTAAGPGNYTRTNVQEAGVDEADMVKTDGKFVYTIDGGEVVIVKSWPASRAHVVGRFALPAEVMPQQLFLRGDRLVVLSSVYQQFATGPFARPVDRIAERRPFQAAPYFSGTRVTVVDVSDRARPRAIHHSDFEGYLATARLMGDDVYLVSNAALTIPPAVLAAATWRAAQIGIDKDIPDQARAAAARQRAFRVVRAHLEQKFGRLNLAGIMPRQRHAGGSGAMSPLRPLYGCQDLMVPESGAQLGALNLIHVDLGRPGRPDSVGLMAAGWQIYASTDAIYAAMPNYGWARFGGWHPEAAGDRPNTTDIHKFDLRGESGAPRYAATGTVRGHLLNQFSMSEHRGFLRVATTDANDGWRAGAVMTATGNHLYVLAERGDRLIRIGAIENLAAGERIYSARMVGDKGYLVTFRQTDPLFTLDLSNPRRPRVVGELEINGFSSYIHPVGANHLITIGQDATSEGRVLGAHIQLFDVSDPSRPRRTAHHRLVDDGETAWSAAQWDHHAFTYDAESGVLALPMASYRKSDGASGFVGLVLFQVSRGGFEEIGRISHGDDWNHQIQRSIVIDDYLVSLSPFALQVNALTQPERTLARVALSRDSVVD